MNKDYNLSPEEKWEQATLANDFIFYKVMRNHQEECKHLIEMLLGVKINKMEMHNEETIDLDHDKKGIRLDIFVKETNRMYDIELQVVDTKELPKRSRYYAGLMALDTLKDGEPYSMLRESHVIFICMTDIFKYGLPVYSFENLCREDNEIKLNDQDYKHFFIAPICAKMIKDSELRAFFELLVTNKSSNDYTSNLKSYVEDAKHNFQWRFQYMTYLRQRNYDIETGREEGREEGRREGRSEAIIETAENMLKEGDTYEKISRCTGLPLEKIQELASQITQEA